jgi:2',3'-cyclic-nucleotide 2'-phosphodiesterase/3'-nucleotidase
LIDNGDTIQGTALADYQALVSPLSCTQKLATYKAMDAIGFDAGTLGNHEFNYGLPFLSQVTGTRFNVEGMAAVASQATCKGPDFPAGAGQRHQPQGREAPSTSPTPCSNARSAGVDKDGKAFEGKIKVAVIGFTPPAHPVLGQALAGWQGGCAGRRRIGHQVRAHGPRRRGRHCDRRLPRGL